MDLSKEPVEIKTSSLASLFVGRWQPFHSGHRSLMETVLKQGKPIVVAIRDTEISHKNPYSVDERWKMVQDALQKYGSLVRIIVIPDIDEICYGRDVGYNIRRIFLEEELESISGTKTREANVPTREIIWLTGQTGAGKSTLAEALKLRMPEAVILDGDEMRQSISLGAGFSKEEREAHNMRVARLAKVLARQSPVIVSVIAPFESTRKNIDTLIKPFWVYIHRPDLSVSSERPYEEPNKPHLKVSPETHTLDQAVGAVLALLQKS